MEIAYLFIIPVPFYILDYWNSYWFRRLKDKIANQEEELESSEIKNTDFREKLEILQGELEKW